MVIGKGDGQLEEKITSQGSTGMPADMPKTGEKVEEKLDNKACTVALTVDAQVVRYDSALFPAVEVIPQKFTQEQADKIIRALVGGAFFYEADEQMSREQLLESIAFYTKKRDEAPEDDTAAYESVIAGYQEALKTAPSSQEYKPAGTAFSEKKAGSSAHSEGISGKFDRNGQTFSLLIQNNDDGRMSNVYFRAVGANAYSPVERADEKTSGAKITYTEALRLAQKLAEDMGTGLSLADAFLVRSEFQNEYAYKFFYTREINGFHTGYDASIQTAGDVEEEKVNSILCRDRKGGCAGIQNLYQRRRSAQHERQRGVPGQCRG